MKRALIGLICLGGLAACDSTVTSQQPLMTAGPESMRPGLWAMLEDGCSRPAGPAVQTWPVCATPFWVAPAQVSWLLPSPNRSPYLLSDGRPAIVQLGPGESQLPKIMRMSEDDIASPEDGDQPPAPSYGYMAFQPEGMSPFGAGRVWDLRCPKDEKPRLNGVVIVEGGCRAETAAGVRALAARVSSREKGYTVVWVAPA